MTHPDTNGKQRPEMPPKGGSGVSSKSTPEELWAKIEEAEAAEKLKTPKFFEAQKGKLELERSIKFRQELRELIQKWWPGREPEFRFSTDVFFHGRYPEAYDAILMDYVCPVVCRGYLDGGENWHQLCLDKVQAMKEAQ